MPLPFLLSLSPSPEPFVSPLPRAQPRGLWKARSRAAAREQRQQPTASPSDTDDDDNNDRHHISLAHPAKRPRACPYAASDDTSSTTTTTTRSPRPAHHQRTKPMDTSSAAGPGSQAAQDASCDYDDWEDLKDLFAKAAEQYESDDAAETLPLLRAVIHECHKFLLFYPDPSVLFTQYVQPRPQQRSWAAERKKSPDPPAPRERKSCKCVELPTAFHVILGTTLFLFGNLIAQDASLALEGEPAQPAPYWLAAIDVFETGEALPSRTSGYSADVPEDWRMAVVWGRTLVCIADEIVNTRKREADNADEEPDADADMDMDMGIGSGIPQWPPESPFAMIEARRPPVSQRITIAKSVPQELLLLAMDLFSRGIFHMPHPQHGAATGSASPGAEAPPPADSFSRAKELFTIGSDVLLLAEKLEHAGERAQWAAWADSVFNQMKMEADTVAWRGPITRARGRAWLVVGSAHAEALEGALERGEAQVLEGDEAVKGREALGKAVSFFEQARGSASAEKMGEKEGKEVARFLAEALLTLANLTIDEAEREALYTRAQVEGGVNLEGDTEWMEL
ncbi:hypothetical protein BD779DRAFT_1500588 [Infundibulicybe gibba]|nr:hypothetical protein BD779DRAFT_1500588 [Infundibulicybe gibba]